MISQELNIAILEMFDEVEKEATFINYLQLEKEILNSDIVKKIEEINNLNEEISRIEYQPYQRELSNKKDIIEKELENNKLYQEYLKAYQLCNLRLQELSKLIFQDIVNVSEMSKCACNKW